jgi:hypothetical protein
MVSELSGIADGICITYEAVEGTVVLTFPFPAQVKTCTPPTFHALFAVFVFGSWLWGEQHHPTK